MARDPKKATNIRRTLHHGRTGPGITQPEDHVHRTPSAVSGIPDVELSECSCVWRPLSLCALTKVIHRLPLVRGIFDRQYIRSLARPPALPVRT